MRVIATVLILVMGFICLVGSPNAAVAANEETCLECHHAGSEQSRRHMAPDVLARSVHGGAVGCLECHPDAADDGHRDYTGVTPVHCRQCHEDQGNHGRAKAPVHCRDCHGSHDIFSSEDTQSRLNPQRWVETCGGCHHRQAAGTGMGAALLSFRVKGHAKSDLGEIYTTDRCLDCHQGAGAHGVPVTTATCDRCHRPGAGEDFFLGTLHAGDDSSADGSWPVPGDWLYWGCLCSAALIFILGWFRRIRIWRRGSSLSRIDQPLRRFLGMIRWVMAQKRFGKKKRSGLWHGLIFWGFLLPLLVILMIQAGPLPLDFLSGIISALLDVGGLALVLGVVLAVVDRVGKLKTSPVTSMLPLGLLALLGGIGVTGLMVEGLRLAVTDTAWHWHHPVGSVLSFVLPAWGAGAKVIWRLHFLLVLAFFSLTPFSSLRHLITAPLNIFFRKLAHPLSLEAFDVDVGIRFGVDSARDLTWKGLLDADACLACGRCEAVCPATRTQKPLSPTALMRTLTVQATNFSTSGSEDRILSSDEMWACTTCGACQQACPVAVEPLAHIVDVRRAAVLNRGVIPPEAADMLRKLEIYGAPGGEGPALRRDWLIGVDTSGLAELNSGHTLLWVGCQGAFHPRARETVQALIRLAARSGRSLSVLGHEESCCGDPARRLGQEALFQTLAKRNIEKMNQQKVRDIITLCPHCRNVLANEYPNWQGDYTVTTALEWAMDLVDTGKLEIRRQLTGKGVYHDPCYLARGAGLVALPRRLGGRLWADGLVTPTESGLNTFCCGAGGGAVWLHESGERINRRRAEQLAHCGAGAAATACPFCIAMLEDGLGDMPLPSMPVVDLVEALEWASR